MREIRKPYQMYVLNLDSVRIFWLSFFFLVLLVLSFIFGFLVGKDYKNKKVEILSTTEATIIPKDLPKEKEDYQFYTILEKENINEPFIKEENKKIAKVEPVIKEKAEPVFNTVENSKGQYTIQVASYRVYKNAENLRKKLRIQNYPAYIIKANVQGEMYYRVRLGSFENRALALKVLDRINKYPECEQSYIISK